MKKLMMSIQILTLSFALCLSPAVVEAVPILDFDIAAPTAGSISYAGGSNPLVGSGISVDTVVGLGTLLNSGVVTPLTGAVLNFATGGFTGFDPAHWNFGGGGTISLTAGNLTLFSGSFKEVLVTYLGGAFKIAGASFTDTKDPDLLSIYGLPNIGYNGNFNISFEASGSPGQNNPFSSTTVLSGDITNSPVPEAGTMLLLGSGLVGLAGLARRKFRK